MLIDKTPNFPSNSFAMKASKVYYGETSMSNIDESEIPAEFSWLPQK